MTPYYKTYRGFNRLPRKRPKNFLFLKIAAVFILDTLFSIILAVVKIGRAGVIKSAPFAARWIYTLSSKIILLPIYRLILIGNRKGKALFPKERNPLFFLVSNRYVSHSVVLLIVLITTIHNLQIRRLRAEEFGRTALFGKLVQGETATEENEEQIIFADTSLEEETEVLPELSQNYVAQKIRLTDAPEEIDTTALAQGGSALIKPNLAETVDTPKPRESAITYLVKADDTIFDIAEQFTVSVNTILWANKLTSRSIIRPGDELKILPVTGVEHTVKAGETVGSIAAKYSVPQEDILEINKLSPADTIAMGSALIIPDGAPLYTPPPPKKAIAKAPYFYPSKEAISGAGALFWPASCRRITQYFRGFRHTGIDIACGSGLNVYAAADGIVEQAKGGWNGGYGNMVIVRHNDGTKTLYGHLQKGGILVSAGEYVSKGQVIGLMGSTGRSTGPHVHFEVIIQGTRVNPFNRL